MGWLALTYLMYAFAAIIVLWIAGALFYDAGGASMVGAIIAVAWVSLHGLRDVCRFFACCQYT